MHIVNHKIVIIILIVQGDEKKRANSSYDYLFCYSAICKKKPG